MTPLQQGLLRLGTRLLRFSIRSWRTTIRYADHRGGAPSAHPFGEEIYAVREGDLVAVTGLSRFARFTTLIARGSDGDWASVVAEGLGCRVVRGSSRHDPAAAAVALTRALRDSSGPAFLVVDGPLGPAGVAKEGIGAIARLTKRPIVPVAADAAPKIVLRKTWSHMFLPFPFARVTISLGDSIHVPHDADRAAISSAATRISAYYAEAVSP